MQKKFLALGTFTYSSGSEKNTDSASIQMSNNYYFDVPSFVRLSERGYQKPFRREALNKGVNNG